MTKILVADDDVNICKLISLYLTKEGHEVYFVHRGDDALVACESTPPDLLILDIMMPGLDGFEVLSRIRRTYTFPILMLTARGEVFDCVQGLELGADDYIVKPFKPLELTARIRALLRRTTPASDDTAALGELIISKTAYTVTWQGQVIPMPPRELELLYFLVKNRDIAFSRDTLLDRVWGYEYNGDSRTVDVHVKRLRERLGDAGAYLQTVWRVGYKCELPK